MARREISSKDFGSFFRSFERIPGLRETVISLPCHENTQNQTKKTTNDNTRMSTCNKLVSGADGATTRSRIEDQVLVGTDHKLTFLPKAVQTYACKTISRRVGSVCVRLGRINKNENLRFSFVKSRQEVSQ